MGTVANTLILTFFGSIITVALNASLLYTSHLIIQRFFKNEQMSVRWIAFGLISIWLVIVPSVVLIFTHLFTLSGITISSGIIFGFACFFWRRHSSLRKELTALYEFILPYSKGRSAIFLLVVFFIIFFQAIRAIMLPPLSWDSLTYHMTLAGLWVQNDGYARLLAPDAWDSYSHFPNNGEVFFAWLMVPFRSDLLVNLGNFPFVLLGAITVYGLAREFTVDREVSLLSGAWVCFSPPLFAYITTQYVDVQCFAEVLCGVFFLVKYIQSLQPRDAIMAFAGFGLAAGTKVITLQLLLLSCAIIIGIVLWKRTSSKTILVMATGIFSVLSTTTVPWYVRNWIETGSPLYPFSFSIGTIKLFQGSQYLCTIMSSLGENLSGGIYESLLYWLRISAFTEQIPLNFGPKFILAVIGGTVGLLLGLRTSNRIKWLIISIICCSEFIQFMSKGMKVVRLEWTDVSQRFLMLFFALMVISGTWVLTRIHKWKQATIVILVCLIILDILVINTNNIYGLIMHAKAEYYLLTVTASTTLVFLYYLFCGKMIKLRVFLSATTIILAVFLSFMQLYRDKTRHFRFIDTIELHDIPRRAVPGWKFVDNPSKPTTIAVTAGWEGVGHNWFLYPLMGRRLQNHLVYISPAQSGGFVSYVPGLDYFRKMDASAWIARIREAGADRVFVFMPPPSGISLDRTKS